MRTAQTIQTIQYISDLHLEFRPEWIDSLIRVVAPILVLCGDIGHPEDPSYDAFLGRMSGRYQKIFVISGNHECYNKTLAETCNIIRNICDRYPNISFLQNSFEDYEGYRFAGTTLWTHISNPLYLSNDFHMIRGITIDSYNKMHDKSRRFIASTLETSPLPVIMMTHHLPSHTLMDPFYSKFIRFQQCFSSSSDDLVRPPIHSWIYGHTHRPYKGILNGVRMFCNPIGYPGENGSPDYDASFTIESLSACDPQSS